MADYPVSDEAMATCRHAATIARGKYHGLRRGPVPPASDETATVTFIEMGGKTYAVTARHVIETFKKHAMLEGNEHEGYTILQAPGAILTGPFLSPPADFPFPQPDIAIRPVRATFPGKFKKTAFRIRQQDDAKWPVTHAIAVGFPTFEKRDKPGPLGSVQLELPCTHALAEGLNTSGLGDQVQFYSELPDHPNVKSLSGMSGGPVFWSDDSNHGLLGFVKEAMDVEPRKGTESIHTNPKVHFLCQRVDSTIIESWIDYTDKYWNLCRNNINEKITRS